MRLSTTRYATMVCIQSTLLLLDVVLNGVSEFLSRESIVLLVTFILQEMCLLFSLIALFLSFFSTYVFQAGLVAILARRFGTAVLICFAYLGLSLALHTWTLNKHWNLPAPHTNLLWSPGFGALFAIQRASSALYYHAYKRAMLRISDPRYYEDIEWIKLQAAESTVTLEQAEKNLSNNSNGETK